MKHLNFIKLLQVAVLLAAVGAVKCIAADLPAEQQPYVVSAKSKGSMTPTADSARVSSEALGRHTFQSLGHLGDGGDDAPGHCDYSITLPPLGKPRGTPEELLYRFHRDGLPLTRLWETDSSMLSLGLNKKGRPGLWFIKRIA